jgi:hypothetical protein
LPRTLRFGTGAKSLKSEVSQARAPSLFFVGGDIVGQQFTVQFQEREYHVVCSGPKVYVYLSGDEEPLGFVRVCGPLGGAIWNSEECIADYSRDEAGNYRVVPIQHGFRCPDDATPLDPIVHLISIAPAT